MSIAHVIYRIVKKTFLTDTKKHENQKKLLPHRNHDCHYFFANRFFCKLYRKKSHFMLYMNY